MNLGYQQLYTNGVNSHTQLRRSVDMVYQRGGTYEVVLTGDTYISSMELDIDLYVDDEKVSRMQVVPYDTYLTGGTYYYRFNVRPYDIVSNYVETEHYNYYWLNDWERTSQHINEDVTYKNNIKFNFKYGYRYISGVTTYTEYETEPTNDYNHYSFIPACTVATEFSASGFTNTGNYFDYIGGVFQLDDKYILPNYDQEIGVMSGRDIYVATYDGNRRLNPMSQYLMDYPSVPEMSETSRFLTDAPRIQYIQADENYVLHFLMGQTGDRFVVEADFAVFEFYDENNEEVYYFEQEITKQGTPYASPTGFTDSLNIFRLPCGPEDIYRIYSTIPATVAYYRVQLFCGYPTDNNTPRVSKGALCPVSEAFYFYIVDNCKPENTRLAWLNPRGGYDYYTFTAFRQDTKKIERQTFDNRYYATSLTSPDRDIARTVKTFDTNVTREIVLETDYISVPVGNWLEQLFISPQVYEMLPDYISDIDRQDKVYKDLRPLQVLSTEVETITRKHRKLNKYRITVKYANSYFVNKGF